MENPLRDLSIKMQITPRIGRSRASLKIQINKKVNLPKKLPSKGKLLHESVNLGENSSRLGEPLLNLIQPKAAYFVVRKIGADHLKLYHGKSLQNSHGSKIPPKPQQNRARTSPLHTFKQLKKTLSYNSNLLSLKLMLGNHTSTIFT